MTNYKKVAHFAEGGEVRSPTSHRTRRQVIRMDREYNSKPEMIRRRSENNKARAVMQKAGLDRKGDGRDVGHIKMLDHGGTTSRSNLRMQSVKKNRGWERD